MLGQQCAPNRSKRMQLDCWSENIHVAHTHVKPACMGKTQDTGEGNAKGRKACEYTFWPSTLPIAQTGGGYNRWNSCKHIFLTLQLHAPISRANGCWIGKVANTQFWTSMPVYHVHDLNVHENCPKQMRGRTCSASMLEHAETFSK